MIRAGTDFRGNPNTLVEQMIGEAYDVVRYVAENMEAVQKASDGVAYLTIVANSITNINSLADNISKLQSIYTNLGQLTAIFGDLPEIMDVHSKLGQLIELYNKTGQLEADAAEVRTKTQQVITISNTFGNLAGAMTTINGLVTSAQNARDAAVVGRDFARAWASRAEDVLVDDGVNPPDYSAKHYAQKAIEAIEEMTSSNTPADNTVSTVKLVNKAVTFAKMSDLGSSGFIGRKTNSLGSPEFLNPLEARRLMGAATVRQASARNRVHDPRLLVSQQNGSVAGVSNNNLYYPADQISVGAAVGIILTSQLTNSLLDDGFSRIKTTVSTGAANLAAAAYGSLAIHFEGNEVKDALLGSAQAKRLTFKFGFKGPAGTYAYKAGNADATRSFIGKFEITPDKANQDVEVIVTFIGDTSGLWNISNGTGISLTIILGAGSNWAGVEGWQNGNKLSVAGVTNNLITDNVFEYFKPSLYIGFNEGEDLPTLEEYSYTDALEKCQRYWYSDNWNILGTANGPNNTGMDRVRFPTNMRTAPSFNTTVNVSQNISSTVIDQQNEKGIRVYIQSAAAGGFQSIGVINLNARM